MASRSSSGSIWTLPYPPRTAMSAAIAGSAQARANAAARTSAAPATYPCRAKTLSSKTGSKPSARSSARPASNSSRLNGLAGDDHGDPVAGPQRARLPHQLDEPRHLGGNRLVLVAAERRAQRGAGQRAAAAPAPGSAP